MKIKPEKLTWKWTNVAKHSEKESIFGNVSCYLGFRWTPPQNSFFGRPRIFLNIYFAYVQKYRSLFITPPVPYSSSRDFFQIFIRYLIELLLSGWLSWCSQTFILNMKIISQLNETFQLRHVSFWGKKYSIFCL